MTVQSVIHEQIEQVFAATARRCGRWPLICWNPVSIRSASPCSSLTAKTNLGLTHSVMTWRVH
jgi:hypothetical protein